MKKECVLKLQEIIKQYHEEDDYIVKDIMKIDYNKCDNEYDYYKSLEGKYLKITFTFNSHVYVHIKSVNKRTISEYEHLHVIVDKLNISYSTTKGMAYIEQDHVLSSTPVNRFECYTEISEEEFNKAYSAIEKCAIIIEDLIK